MGRRSKPKPKFTGPIGGAILQEIGSHDTKIRHGMMRSRIYRPCADEKYGCGALPGHRCLNKNMLPTRVFMIGFHRGR